MEEIMIRLAEEKDSKALAQVKRAAWETTYRGIYPDNILDDYDYEVQEEKFCNLIKSDTINLYVVVDQDEIVGYMSEGVPLKPYGDYQQGLTHLYILKEYQGKGIGKRLFDIAYEGIKKKGYKEFFISCNKYNLNAQKFYEKMGGKIIDIFQDNLDKSKPQVIFHYDIK